MMHSLSSRVSGSSRRNSSYDMLPTGSTESRHARRTASGNPLTRFCTKRITRLVVITSLCLLTVHFFWGVDSVVSWRRTGDPKLLPPLYTEHYLQELRHPQHNPELPFPEGAQGLYIWYSNHVHSSGWGNAMQEHLLNSHLAHEAGRAFVYDNYTWNKDGSNYSDFNGHLIPSRIPITALLRGPAAGGAWPPGDTAPRAVVKEYWDKVCPEPHRMMSEELFNIHAAADAGEVLRTWVEKLKTLPRCVEIKEEAAQIWSVWVFGTKRVLGIWDSLKNSPVITNFRWSQLIEDGFKRNRHLFMRTNRLRDLISPPSAYPYKVIPGLLVLHVRRGDFEEHCLTLARWSAQWNGFNQFPELPDRFEPPPSAGWGEYTEEGKNIYLKHCFPDIEQIISRITEVRATPAGKGLKNVFIMTNGKQPWLGELQSAIAKMGGWDKIASSRDMTLDWEQQYIAQSVDMLIGQRAQVIIGNGFSSLTSNIVMLRMAQNISADANRFW